MKIERKKRIFWLGMHKVLVETEFAFLKKMGYEVFRPPYLSPIRDQSACYTWEAGETTLPDHVIKKLSEYNFFYNPISSKIGKILNEYFDIVIVTIHPDWLCHILKVFSGVIFYRCYGQIGTVSDRLLENGAFDLIEGRGDFWFLPHAEECLADEQSWLQKYARVIPYWMTDDVYDLKDTWKKVDRHRETIALSCPNIANAYYQKHFRYLKEYFEQRWFRYYGVQLEPNADPNVVGTLSRKEFLTEFKKESGYLYSYRERNVCYLPPIEMMILGGPVLYFPGSLLHRYFGFDSPGLVKNEEEAMIRARQLVKNDQALISEIISSQESVRNRYLKYNVQSKFKGTIDDLINGKCHPVKEKIMYDPKELRSDGLQPVMFLGHFPNNYVHSNGEYASVNGIPRVMRQFVRALNLKGIPVVVTALDKDITKAHGFYASACPKPELVRVWPLPGLKAPGIKEGGVRNRAFLTLGWCFETGISVLMRTSPSLYAKLSDVWMDRRRIGHLKELLKFIKEILFEIMRPPFIFFFLKGMVLNYIRVKKNGKVAGEPGRWRYAIVPHYYLFPEAVNLKSPLLAYIPDYMPHFFSGRDGFADTERYVNVGKTLVVTAKRVFTNSHFSQSYLPQSALGVPEEKIVSFRMPYLSADDQKNKAHLVSSEIIQKLTGKAFCFYPTQSNYNKRLDLLIRSWCLASKKLNNQEVFLVLTALEIPESLISAIEHHGLKEKIVVFPSINDATLSWLYRHAVCLAFSSEMEGNFPTQVLEALMTECPIVCMDHPLIQSELGLDARLLLTAPFADVEKFSELILYSMNHRAEILDKQRVLKERISERFEFKAFAENVWKLDDLMASP